jgi:hypothetical protein
MRKNKKENKMDREKIEDIDYEFALCAIFGAGVALGATVVISINELI